MNGRLLELVRIPFRVTYFGVVLRLSERDSDVSQGQDGVLAAEEPILVSDVVRLEEAGCDGRDEGGDAVGVVGHLGAETPAEVLDGAVTELLEGQARRVGLAGRGLVSVAQLSDGVGTESKRGKKLSRKTNKGRM